MTIADGQFVVASDILGIQTTANAALPIAGGSITHSLGVGPTVAPLPSPLADGSVMGRFFSSGAPGLGINLFQPSAASGQMNYLEAAAAWRVSTNTTDGGLYFESAPVATAGMVGGAATRTAVLNIAQNGSATFSGWLQATSLYIATDPTDWSIITLQRPDGQAAQIVGGTTAAARWSIKLGDETADASFVVIRYNTAGSTVDRPISINRSTGVITQNATTLTGALLLAADPTVALGASTKQYVDNRAATTLPIVNGVAAIGVGTTFARADHVHGTDTSRAALASPAFTGTPTVPTPPIVDNSGLVPNTAWVWQNATMATYQTGGTFDYNAVSDNPTGFHQVGGPVTTTNGPPAYSIAKGTTLSGAGANPGFGFQLFLDDTGLSNDQGLWWRQMNGANNWTTSVWHRVMTDQGGTFTGTVGFNNSAPVAKPTVTGAKASNAALASLLAALASYGLVTDSTTT